MTELAVPRPDAVVRAAGVAGALAGAGGTALALGGAAGTLARLPPVAGDVTADEGSGLPGPALAGAPSALADGRLARALAGAAGCNEPESAEGAASLALGDAAAAATLAPATLAPLAAEAVAPVLAVAAALAGADTGVADVGAALTWLLPAGAAPPQAATEAPTSIVSNPPKTSDLPDLAFTARLWRTLPFIGLSAL